MKVEPGGVSMWLQPEDSHRWSVGSKKLGCSWSVGNKPKLVKGTWSYSRVMRALANPDWCRCCKIMLPTSLLCVGSVAVCPTIRILHSIPLLTCSNAHG